MADANRTLAGKFHAEIGDQRFEIIGELTIETSNERREGKATSSGKVYVTVEAKPFRAKCKFGNYIKGDPMAFFNVSDPFNITFNETTRRVRHLFTNASAVGEPSKNLQNGECDGIEIVTDKYQSVGP